MTIAFVRYREKWGHGNSSWDYFMVHSNITEESLREMMEEEGAKHEYSEHFRGMEWERCVPPEDVLDKMITSAENNLVAAERRLLNLRSYKVQQMDLADDTPLTPE